VELAIDDVRRRTARHAVDLRAEAVESAVAALNTGAHVALLPDYERALTLGQILVEAAADAGFCIGSLSFYRTAAALITLRELLQPSFLSEFWVVLAAPSSTAISRVMDEVRSLWCGSDARLVAVTTLEDLRDANLTPAARRALVPIHV